MLENREPKGFASECKVSWETQVLWVQKHLIMIFPPSHTVFFFPSLCPFEDSVTKESCLREGAGYFILINDYKDSFYEE